MFLFENLFFFIVDSITSISNHIEDCGNMEDWKYGVWAPSVGKSVKWVKIEHYDTLPTNVWIAIIRWRAQSPKRPSLVIKIVSKGSVFASLHYSLHTQIKVKFN